MTSELSVASLDHVFSGLDDVLDDDNSFSTHAVLTDEALCGSSANEELEKISVAGAEIWIPTEQDLLPNSVHNAIHIHQLSQEEEPGHIPRPVSVLTVPTELPSDIFGKTEPNSGNFPFASNRMNQSKNQNLALESSSLDKFVNEGPQPSGISQATLRQNWHSESEHALSLDWEPVPMQEKSLNNAQVLTSEHLSMGSRSVKADSLSRLLIRMQKSRKTELNIQALSERAVFHHSYTKMLNKTSYSRRRLHAILLRCKQEQAFSRRAPGAYSEFSCIQQIDRFPRQQGPCIDKQHLQSLGASAVTSSLIRDQMGSLIAKNSAFESKKVSVPAVQLQHQNSRTFQPMLRKRVAEMA